MNKIGIVVLSIGYVVALINLPIVVLPISAVWACWHFFLREWITGLPAMKDQKAVRLANGISDETYFANAHGEVANNVVSPGLWAQAFAEMQGDDTRAKALYLKLRVTSMKAEAAAKIREGL